MTKFEDFLGKSFDCECGKKHKIDVERILIKDEIKSDELKEEMEKLNLKNPLFVCDENTLKASERLLSGYEKLLILEPRNRVLADMENVEKVIKRFKEENCDSMISIGSGTINDITKYAAYKLGLGYICIPTAPSVDGYTSPVSPILVEGFKETFDAVQPKIVLVDLEIVSGSPINLIKAGVGDAMAKVTARMDWLLSKVINSEYICDFTWKMMVDDIREISESIEALLSRDINAIKVLTRLLINSGIAMSMVGNSRPASGAEHIISHFIEMHYEMNNKLPLFHGIQVSLGTLISLNAYKCFFNGLNFEVMKINDMDRERSLKDTFGDSLGGKLMKIYLEKSKKLKRPDESTIEKAKEEILPVYQEFSVIAEKSIRMLDLENEYSKIDRDLLLRAVMFSNCIRERYTIFDLFDSMNVLKSFAIKAIKEV